MADVVLEEAYNLASGWNLIHLPLEPLEKNAETALAAVDWQSMWLWLPEAVAGAEPGRGGHWLAMHRGQPSFLSNLASFSGPASYAIRVGAPGTLRVKGRLRSERSPLRGSTFQLLGPNVPTSEPPSAAAYFSRPDVIENIGSLYGLVDGTYRKVQPAEALRRGAAYWVRPALDIPEPHPLRLGAGFGGLRFDTQTTVQEIDVDLGAAASADGGGAVEPRELHLRTIPSVDSNVAADWLDLQLDDGTFAPLTANTVIEVAPDVTRARLTLRARSEGVASPNAAQRALAVEITGPAGSLLVGADLNLATLEGIWMGEANLSEIERPTVHGGGYAPVEPVPAALIVEISASGQPRILPCIQVEGDRDARKVKYRLEAALFHEVVSLLGTLGAQGTTGTLVGSLSLPMDHPLNPYRHRYNPEHTTGYDVTRSIKLRFGASLPGQTPAGVDNPFATVGRLSGVYEEEIVGLTQEPIRVRGTFQLRRLSGGTVTPCATVSQ
jgi:hypothetical protein